MKKIYLIITIVLVSTYSCNAQLNELTQTEYYNIKINDVTLQDIYDTNADVTEMKALFGSDLLHESENDILIRKEFWKPNLFYFNFNSDMGINYFPTIIKIRSSLVNITVKEMTVKLGDDVDVFGANPITNTINGDNSVVFGSELSASIAFKIDPVTNKIVEIEINAF